jgi:hypothetical protein
MNKMSYAEFLATVKVMRMFYGVREAKKFFEKNLAQFPQFNYDGITTLGKNVNESE